MIFERELSFLIFWDSLKVLENPFPLPSFLGWTTHLELLYTNARVELFQMVKATWIWATNPSEGQLLGMGYKGGGWVGRGFPTFLSEPGFKKSSFLETTLENRFIFSSLLFQTLCLSSVISLKTLKSQASNHVGSANASWWKLISELFWILALFNKFLASRYYLFYLLMHLESLKVFLKRTLIDNVGD